MNKGLFFKARLSEIEGWSYYKLVNEYTTDEFHSLLENCKFIRCQYVEAGNFTHHVHNETIFLNTSQIVRIIFDIDPDRYRE